MRRSVFLSLAVLGAAIALWLFLKTPSEPALPLSGTNIIAFGDSLIEGVGATPGHDVVSLLTRDLGQPVINAGKSGDTTDTALRRLEEDVLSQDPRIVIILLGGNDAIRRVPPEQTFANLDTILTRIREQGAAVVLVGVQGGFFNSTYAKRFPELADKHNALYIADILDDIIGHRELMSDLIHPNDQGYRKMTNKITPELRRLLQP
jgi:lysophospholipase L1-like esterase